MRDPIERQEAIDAIRALQTYKLSANDDMILVEKADVLAELMLMPQTSEQPEYEPVKAEDFAKTMSENTLYSFMAWYGEALELMERQGFVICKRRTDG